MEAGDNAFSQVLALVERPAMEYHKHVVNMLYNELERLAAQSTSVS